MAQPRTKAASAQSIRVRLRTLPRNVWTVTVTSLFTDISTDMIINLLPLFLSNVLGASTGIIGLIEGAAETTAGLLKLISGWLSDRLGRRKWLTVLGYSLSTLAKPLLFFAGSWGVVLAVRVVDRIGKGIRTAPRDALVADSITPEQRGVAFGLHRAGDTAGATLGLCGALLLIWLAQGNTTLLTPMTFRLLVVISILPALLAVIVLVLGTRDVPVTTRRTLPRLAFADFERPFKLFMLSIVIFTLGNSSDAFIVLRAQERGLSLVGVLGMLISFNLIYTLVSIPAGAWSDRIGRRRVVLVGWLLYALVYAGLALADSGIQVWLWMTIYGVFYGLTNGTTRALVADLVMEDQRGTAYGIYNAGVALMALPASVVAGIVWQGIGGWAGFGPRAPFLLGALLALVAGVVLWQVRPGDHGPIAGVRDLTAP